jgi:hypothetical protein
MHHGTEEGDGEQRYDDTDGKTPQGDMLSYE